MGKQANVTAGGGTSVIMIAFTIVWTRAEKMNIS